jgi:hypothetical protein
MKWWILMFITTGIFEKTEQFPPLRSYRVTLEKITLIKSEGEQHSESLFGSVWTGAFCNSNDNQVGASFDSRERTLKLFDRTADNYIKIMENNPLPLNQALVFDIPACDKNQANIMLTASLKNRTTGRQYATEQQRVYLSEITGSIRHTMHCYERESHLQLSFIITLL